MTRSQPSSSAWGDEVRYARGDLAEVARRGGAVTQVRSPAVAIANDSMYGLSGSVWSADVERALRVARRLRTGMVGLNGFPQAFSTPFGGFKQSGLGREMGPEGLRTYLEPVSIALGP